MPKLQGYALGVDIGGTFTDLALLERATGRLMAGKVLTDHEDFSRGVQAGVEAIVAENEIRGTEITSVTHGTTLATNALIERTGARSALLVTAGFRDVLETARGTRYDIFDLTIEMPEPLVPRALVLEVDERIDANGRPIRPVAAESVRGIARRLIADGIESVAVCLFHSYANPDHERAVGAILAKEAPELDVSLSCDVIPAIGEYDRASTTVANVYLRPVLRGYLERLRKMLKQLGISRPPVIMTSDGGTISCDTAVHFPVRLIESGPAGGAIAAAYFGELAELDRVIGFDMGGTTAKICVIDDFAPERTTEFEVARIARFAKGSGLPLKVPAVELIEIGAGGGSIAAMDGAGLLKVGPRSAGAHPGPACYGLSGNCPTVTDANLCLGYLDPSFFLGGSMALHRDRAVKAIRESVAVPLGLDFVRAAWGIHEVVNNNMARAARIHCMERGKDPRLYTLVAFGGCGPIHAYRIAEIMGIRRVFYPAHAGIMSAVGFLVARPSFELFRSYEMPLVSGNVRQINKLFKEMEAEGRQLLRSAGVSASAVQAQRELGVRYRGQAFVLNVPAPTSNAAAKYLAEVEAAFLKQYRERYHQANEGVPLEVVNLRSLVQGPRPEAAPRSGQQCPKSRPRKGYRDVFLPEYADFVRCPVYDRYSLKGRLKGPAVIEERESTVVVGPGSKIAVDEHNNLLVDLPLKGRATASAASKR